VTKKDLSQLDPDAQRPLLLIRRLTMGLVGAVLFLGAVVSGVALRGESTREIVTKSACAIDPESAECQTIKRESDEARPARDFCIGAEKIDHDGELLALTTCREARHRHARAAADALTDTSAGDRGGAELPAEGGSGAALAPATTDSGHAPAPHGNAPPPEPGEGGSAPASEPVPSPPAPAPPAPTQPTPSPSATDSPPPPAVQPGVVQSTVDTVDDAITPTVCAVSEVLRHACP
jgi:hypothetical protein